MNPRQLGSPLLRFLEVFADLCIVSIYWLVCCIPIVTIGASSAALYSTATKAIRDEKGTLTKTFFSEFRDSLRQGIFLSLIFVGGCGLLIFYNFLGESIPSEAGYFIAYWAVVILLTLILTGTFIYVFPLLAHFRQKTWTLLRTGFYLSVGYPIKTLGLICLLALAALAAWKAPLLMLLLPGAYALIASIIQEPILDKHTAEVEDSSQT
ncbi:MAG: hypothetical protein CVU91_00535 [Firmicutes bacterium HGW-Firmicutes-16]|nr:MAG: hypothetical protein CVU91_00535 [Firmicutes bacterium HGW-Firmicutes-16]